MSDLLSKRHSRREVLRLAGAAGLGAIAGPALLGGSALGARRPAALTRVGPSAALAGGKLKVGYLPITDASPLLLAHSLDYYSQEGLEVE